MISVQSQDDFLKNKNKFIVFAKPAVEKTVRYFIFQGFFEEDDFEDVVQEINLHLLEKSEKIISGFQGKAKFTSYITTIIINHCRHLSKIRKFKKNERLEEYHVKNEFVNPVPASILKDEFRKVSTFFDLMFRKKHKLILCLKVIYRIPVTSDDIHNVFPEKKAGIDAGETIRELFKGSNDKESYLFLTKFLNQHEGKENSPDAVRKWTDLKIEEIITFMNGKPKVSSYSKETIQILLEKYFVQKH